MKKLSKKELATALNRLLTNGKNDISLDKEDIDTIINREGSIAESVVDYTGEKAAYKAVKSAIEELENDYAYISNADGVLVHFTLHPARPLMDITEAMELIDTKLYEEAYSGFCTSSDKNISENHVRVTVIVNKFDIQKLTPANNIES